MVNAITHIHIKPPRLSKEGFVAGGAAAIAVAGGLGLAIRLRFHNHAPQQLARGLPFHKAAADEVRSDHLSGAGEEGLREDWEALGGRAGHEMAKEGSAKKFFPIPMRISKGLY